MVTGSAVISADGWDEVPLPIIDWYRRPGQTAVVRADTVRHAGTLRKTGTPRRALCDPPAANDVRFYNQRAGTAELWIKKAKPPPTGPRLSCHRFRANEVRLLLGVIAYNLGNLQCPLVLPMAEAT